MSEDLADRVMDLLEAVQTDLHADAVPDDVTSMEDIAEDSSLIDHAATAREIIVTNDPDTVLDAVGLEADGDGSSSIPAAIASGSETDVRELRALVQLAGLDTAGDESGDEIGDTIQTLRETLASIGAEETSGQDDRDSQEGSDRQGNSDSQVDPDRQDDRDSEDDRDAQAESDSRQESDQQSESAAQDGQDSQSESGSDQDEGDLGGLLQTATGTTLEAFEADLESLRGQLESALGDDSESASSDADSSEADEDDTGDEASAESSEDESADESDDDLFDIGSESDDRGRSTMYSTMPSSDRADMRAVRRHSTMPDRR